MIVMGFNCAIFMRLAGIVAACDHPIVPTERFVAFGDILRDVFIEVAVSGRQAVGAAFPWRATQRPERILEVFCQRRETLSARNRCGMLPPAAGENKMEKSME